MYALSRKINLKTTFLHCVGYFFTSIIFISHHTSKKIRNAKQIFERNTGCSSSIDIKIKQK